MRYMFVWLLEGRSAILVCTKLRVIVVVVSERLLRSTEILAAVALALIFC
jgi:hypothetical protein